MKMLWNRKMRLIFYVKWCWFFCLYVWIVIMMMIWREGLVWSYVFWLFWVVSVVCCWYLEICKRVCFIWWWCFLRIMSLWCFLRVLCLMSYKFLWFKYGLIVVWCGLKMCFWWWCFEFILLIMFNCFWNESVCCVIMWIF